MSNKPNFGPSVLGKRPSIKRADGIEAAPGKLRACTLIDSEIYQIEEDVNTLEEAKELCYRCGGFVSIYDEHGNSIS